MARIRLRARAYMKMLQSRPVRRKVKRAAGSILQLKTRQSKPWRAKFQGKAEYFEFKKDASEHLKKLRLKAPDVAIPFGPAFAFEITNAKFSKEGLEVLETPKPSVGLPGLQVLGRPNAGDKKSARDGYRNYKSEYGYKLWHLQPGDCFIDAGASIGGVSCVAIEAGAARVLAVELDINTFGVLLRNLIGARRAMETSGRPAADVWALHGAITGPDAGPSVVVMSNTSQGSYRSRVGAVATRADTYSGVAPTCTISQLRTVVPAGHHWCLAKFDIEGSEHLAFHRAINIEPFDTAPFIVFEYSRNEGVIAARSRAGRPDMPRAKAATNALHHMKRGLQEAGYRVAFVGRTGCRRVDPIVYCYRALQPCETACANCRRRTKEVRRLKNTQIDWWDKLLQACSA